MVVKSKNKQITATKVRALMISGLILTVAAVAGISWMGYSWIKQENQKLQELKNESSTLSNQLNSIQSIKNDLQKNQSTVKKSEQLVLSSDLPQFQIINILQTYASKNSIPLESISLGPASTSTRSSSGTSSSSTSSSSKSVVQSPNSITLSFSGPMEYSNFLNFLNDIETSLPKMNVTAINIQGGPNSSQVRVDPITINTEQKRG